MIKNLATNYLNDIKRVLDCLPLDKVEEFVKYLLVAYEGEKQIFVFGNGGSGGTASHFVCDINKGVSSGCKKRFKVMCLNDNIPIILAYANDMSYEDIFVEQLKNYLKPLDCVIGISGSGNSRNVLKAIEYANTVGAKTFGITGYDGGALSNISHSSIIVKIDDMQKVEDVHMILVHLAMQILIEELNRGEDGHRL
ncbi:MAG: SIS domain-containing protein [Candidatus Brocadiaceae bacterium]|nr:SIS domain-containing protein [Candidatus Brocadiaceae bacterium]